jgi:hypothetical protein
MGIMSGLFALLGLLMAGRAHDKGILLFGLALFAAGVLFAWWMIKTAYDEVEAGGDPG